MDDRLVKLDILGHDDPTALRMLQDLTGIDPTTMKPVFVATTPADKADQRSLFFFYRPEMQPDIIASLRRSGNARFIAQLFPGQRRDAPKTRDRGKKGGKS